MFVLVVRQLFIMLLIAFSGFIVTKNFGFGEKEQKFVSKILTYFINPSLIIARFDMDFNFERLKTLGIVILLSIVIHFVMILVSILFIRKRTPVDYEFSDIERVGIVFTNCGFIGIPLISGVFPDSNGVFYLLNHISSMNTGMAMFLLGMLFVTFGKFKKEYLTRAIKVCFVKYFVIALAVLAVVFGAYHLLQNVNEIRLICYVCFIAALCPVGMMVSSFAVLFNKDESYTAFLTLVTSVVSLVMLPLSVLAAEQIF